MKKFSTTDVTRMQNLYKRGVMIKTIADSFDCDPTTVGYHVNATTKNRKIGRYMKHKIQNMSDIDAYKFVSSYFVD